MKKTIFLLLLSLIILAADAQVSPGKYVAWLTDKNDNPYTLSNPSAFLSQRSLERRARFSIPLDSYDLPVTPAYIAEIEAVGVEVIHASKWLNAVVFQTEDSLLAGQVAQLPFVKKLVKNVTASGRKNLSGTSGVQDGGEGLRIPFAGYTAAPIAHGMYKQSSANVFDYGAAFNQIHMLKGEELHNRGYSGNGIMIALLDAGYWHVDQLGAFDSLWARGQILGTRDFVQPGANVFGDDMHGHGMMVLSTMGAQIPGQIVGTAPHADYFLIRTEDGATEYLIEEYNWVSGAELADSLGADVINSSLGYTTYDDPAQSHTYADMDGNTAIATLGADRAASRGILVVNSAGNSGASAWRYIGAPADGDSVFTLGAVDFQGIYASFSSVGPTSDGRVKPNIATQGQGTAFIGYSNTVSYGNGTSFSSPIAAGMMACLWQAHPELNNMQLMNAVMQTASRANQPDSLTGFGIPDFFAAYASLSTGNPEQESSVAYVIGPNPFADRFTIYSPGSVPESREVEVWSADGRKVFAGQWFGSSSYQVILPDRLPQGLYLLRVSAGGFADTHRLIKLNN